MILLNPAKSRKTANIKIRSIGKLYCFCDSGSVYLEKGLKINLKKRLYFKYILYNISPINTDPDRAARPFKPPWRQN